MIKLVFICSRKENLGIINILSELKEIQIFCFIKEEWLDYIETLPKYNNIVYDKSLQNINKIKDLSIILSDEAKYKLDIELENEIPFLNALSFKFFQNVLEEMYDRGKEFKNNIEAQKIISDLGLKLTSSKTLQEISDNIVSCALGLTKTPAGSLVLYDDKENTLNLLATKGFSEEFSKTKTYHVRKGGMTEYILQQNKPIVINDLSMQPSFNNPLMLKEKVSSLIATTLKCEGKTIGILYVDDFVVREYMPEQIASLSLLAMEAAFGIEKIRLLTQLENKNIELKKTTDYMKAILDNSADMIVTTDSTTKIVEFNKGGEHILGYKYEDVVGTTAERFYRHAKERQKIIEKIQKEGEIANYETKLRHKDGRLVDISLSISQLKDKNGEVIGTVGMSKDITKQKHLEKKLRESNKELAKKITEVQKIDKMKSDFLSVVSHELRTPLTSILGFAKMIHKKFERDIVPNLNMEDSKISNTTGKITDNLKIITSEGERLARLINNVLDLAKIEAGKLEWKMEPVKVEDICQTAIYATSSLAEERKLELKFIPEQHLPMINVDKDRLIQVVTNIISNAIKFTNSGSVTCTAKKIKDHIEIRIQDTGIGIKPEHISKVFEKFKQVGEGDTISDRPKGTGLGLTICKEIVEAHGGKIWVESEYGKGSTFIFYLPAIMEASNVEEKLEYIPLARNIFIDRISNSQKVHLILVFDDEAHIRSLLRQQLEDEGYRVIEAGDGNEAILKAREEKPDLIICDILMPGLSGFDILTVLKTNKETSNIPILIHSVFEDKEKGFRLGADDYITKSVNAAEKLIKSVSELLSGKKSAHKKVLLIEENKSVSKSVQEALILKGYEVVSAYTGKEGLEKAKIENPDLIIIDDIISKSNNYELIKTLKYVKGSEKSSIIVLTRDKQTTTSS
ncbi:MAG: response regulator [Candidatus Firestonebacteria bacterium]|nr:response regulator [Candidatus Firestonebacteria bacterium]